MELQKESEVSYISFLRSIINYNNTIANLYDLFLEECNYMLNNFLFIIVVSALLIGSVMNIILFNIYNNMYIQYPIIDSTIVPISILSASLMEIAPLLTSIIYLGEYCVTNSIELFSKREEIDSYSVRGINGTSMVCLPKLLSILLISPGICVLACFFIILGSLLCTYFFYSDFIANNDYLTSLIFTQNKPYIFFCIIKTILISFFLCTISSYIGCFYYKPSCQMKNIGEYCFFLCCIITLITNCILDIIFLYKINL